MIIRQVSLVTHHLILLSVSSVRNVVYLVAVKGKNILGPTKRRFFP